MSERETEFERVLMNRVQRKIATGGLVEQEAKFAVSELCFVLAVAKCGNVNAQGFANDCTI